MEIVYKKVNELIPYINNSRTHSEEQVNQIVASINEFGFTNPLLIDEKDSIIAGHGRLLASKKLGMEEVPCIVLKGLTEAQKKAYIIADNKMALNAGWDDELLKIENYNFTIVPDNLFNSSILYAFLIFYIYLPFLNKVANTSPLLLEWWFYIILFVLLAVLPFDIFKILNKKSDKSKKN